MTDRINDMGNAEPVDDGFEDEDELGTYFRKARSWSSDREKDLSTSRRTAWIVAAAVGAIALLEAIALIILLPLKTVEPYTLLVDRQTGYVQALEPLDADTVAPDEALVRSFLAQYVIARESFNIDSLQHDYRKTALWSQGDARRAYIAQAQASNPASNLASLPRDAIVEVEIRSISHIGEQTALVRYVTIRTNPGGQRLAPQAWAAVIRYRFSGEAMSAEDRLLNPLGFQVTRYSTSAELAGSTSLDSGSSETVRPAPSRTRARITPIGPVSQDQANGEGGQDDGGDGDGS